MLLLITESNSYFNKQKNRNYIQYTYVYKMKKWILEN